MPVYNANPLPGAPLIAETIEALGAQVGSLYAQLELRLLMMLDERVRQGLATDDLAERAAIAFQMQDEARLILTGVDPTVLGREVAAIAADEGDRAALARLGLAPKIATTFSAFSTTQAIGIASIAAQLTGGLGGLNPHILRSTADTYQRVVANVSSQVLGGAITRYQAGREATRQLVTEGLPHIRYTNGARMPIGSYAEMATRTAANRAWQEGHIGRMQSNGMNLVTIVVGIGACKACARWAGKVLSLDGTTGTVQVEHATQDGLVTVTIDGTLADARAHGWNHPNCRCSIAAYFPGLRAPGSASTYDPDAERARAELRRLERGKREALRAEALAPDDLARAAARRRVRSFNDRIGQHTKATGLVRQRYRESLIFAGDKPGRAPRLPAPRPVAKPPAPAATPKPPRPAAQPPSSPVAGVTRSPEDVLGPRPAASVPSNTPFAEREAARDRLRAWDKAALEIERENVIATSVPPLSREARLQAFAEAKDAATIGKLLAREVGHRGITVAGFTARQSVETAREFAETITDLLDQYPQIVMHRINMARMSPRAYAHVRSVPTTGLVELELNTKFAGDRQTLLEALARDAAEGFHPAGFDTARGVIAHEFGHVIDAQNGFRAGNSARQALEAAAGDLGMRPVSAEFAKWRRDQLPGYAFTAKGALNGMEAIAEAFGDVFLNGKRASLANQILYRHLVASIGGVPIV